MYPQQYGYLIDNEVPVSALEEPYVYSSEEAEALQQWLEEQKWFNEMEANMLQMEEENIEDTWKVVGPRHRTYLLFEQNEY